MTCYVYAVTTKQKWITWKCKDRHEARIVMSNIARSALLNSILTIDLSYSVDQPWLKQCYGELKRQFITYESNKTYYYPKFIRGEVNRW